MTTFGYNFELIEPLVKTGVKVILANEWTDLKEPKIEKNVHDYPNLTIIRPPKDPQMGFRGAFHPKLWVFKFSTFLRYLIMKNSHLNSLKSCSMYRKFNGRRLDNME